MPHQKSQAVLQRRLLVLECVRRLSGRSERWVTVGEIVNDLQQQGYAVETHSIRRDMKSLLETYPQLECNDNSHGNGEAKSGLAHGYRWVGKDEQMLAMLTARLEVDGVVLFTDKGYAYAHPAWGMRTATEERIYKWMSSLGLTPSDRARLGIAMVQARTLLEEFREKFAALPTGPRAG